MYVVFSSLYDPGPNLYPGVRSIHIGYRYPYLPAVALSGTTLHMERPGGWAFVTGYGGVIVSTSL